MLVIKSQAGDTQAYDRLVQRYQDMAVGYADSLLGDYDLAQDAALDAFIQAYRDLPTLRAPAAFSAWLRRILFKQCDRITRGRHLSTVPMEVLGQIASTEIGPEQAAERRELRETVRGAIESLPPGERVVTVLFYMAQHSYGEIAGFLGVPVTTVKSRLHSARRRLKERMITMVQDNLHSLRPSRNDAFAARVREDIARALAEIAAGDVNEAAIRQFHPQARYRAPHSVYRFTTSLVAAGLARGASEIHLVPGSGEVHILFVIDGVEEEFITLPESLHDPVTARLKDGEGLNIDERHRAQEGFIPVHNTRDDRRCDMRVFCHPGDQGEKIILRFVPTA